MSSIIPNRQSCPPGLLATVDLAERIPERAEDIVSFEIERRRFERVGLDAQHRAFAWHPWGIAKLLILSGITAFSIAWGTGILLDFLKLYETTISKANSIPSSLGITIPQLNAFIPTETVGILGGLPKIGVAESVWIALGVMFSIGLVEAAVIAYNWNKIKLVNEQIARNGEETQTLNAWLGAIREKGMKKKPNADEVK